MNKLIVTRADSNIQEMIELTHPIIRKYAAKCEAEFKVIEETKDLHPHYRILQLYDLFSDYDRIAVIDTDTIILNTCPDIFETVPDSMIGSIFEDKGSRKIDRQKRLQLVQEYYTQIGLVTGYINTGIAVFSKSHREIFKYEEGQALWLNLGFDDVYLRYMSYLAGIQVYELSYKWNHMSMYSEPWHNANRYDSYILHYAGNGFYPSLLRVDQIKQDLILLNRYNRLL